LIISISREHWFAKALLLHHGQHVTARRAGTAGAFHWHWLAEEPLYSARIR